MNYVNLVTVIPSTDIARSTEISRSTETIQSTETARTTETVRSTETILSGIASTTSIDYTTVIVNTIFPAAGWSSAYASKTQRLSSPPFPFPSTETQKVQVTMTSDVVVTAQNPPYPSLITIDDITGWTGSGGNVTPLLRSQTSGLPTTTEVGATVTNSAPLVPSPSEVVVTSTSLLRPDVTTTSTKVIQPFISAIPAN